MVRTAEAKRAGRAAQPELTLLATAGRGRSTRSPTPTSSCRSTCSRSSSSGAPGDQRERNLELGTSWFQHRDEWAAMPADDGPAEWQRIDVAVDESRAVPDPNRAAEDPDTRGKQVDIVVPAQTIEPVALPPVDGQRRRRSTSRTLSFDVDQVGVPVLVKVSYFPNWARRRRRGPVPHRAEHDGRRADRQRGAPALRPQPRRDLFFYVLTLVGIGLLVVFRIQRRRRHVATRSPRRPAPAAPTSARRRLDDWPRRPRRRHDGVAAATGRSRRPDRAIAGTAPIDDADDRVGPSVAGRGRSGEPDAH